MFPGDGWENHPDISPLPGGTASTCYSWATERAFAGIISKGRCRVRPQIASLVFVRRFQRLACVAGRVVVKEPSETSGTSSARPVMTITETEDIPVAFLDRTGPYWSAGIQSRNSSPNNDGARATRPHVHQVSRGSRHGIPGARSAWKWVTLLRPSTTHPHPSRQAYIAPNSSRRWLSTHLLHPRPGIFR